MSDYLANLSSRRFLKFNYPLVNNECNLIIRRLYKIMMMIMMMMMLRNRVRLSNLSIFLKILPRLSFLEVILNLNFILSSWGSYPSLEQLSPLTNFRKCLMNPWRGWKIGNRGEFPGLNYWLYSRVFFQRECSFLVVYQLRLWDT